MAQQYKLERVAKLKEEIKSYPSFIFTDYRGMNVGQMSDLRNSLKERGVEFHVVKNRNVKRVFHELGYEDALDRFLVDPTALVYFDADISEIAKILADAARETSLQIKGGYTRARVLAPDELERIAKLPPRDVLLAQVIGTMNAPVTGLVFVLQGLIAKFVRTLKAVEAQLSES
jgi:large subunit ribosomal protein L10